MVCYGVEILRVPPAESGSKREGKEAKGEESWRLTLEIEALLVPEAEAMGGKGSKVGLVLEEAEGARDKVEIP